MKEQWERLEILENHVSLQGHLQGASRADVGLEVFAVEVEEKFPFSGAAGCEILENILQPSKTKNFNQKLIY